MTLQIQSPPVHWGWMIALLTALAVGASAVSEYRSAQYRAAVDAAKAAESAEAENTGGFVLPPEATYFESLVLGINAPVILLVAPLYFVLPSGLLGSLLFDGFFVIGVLGWWLLMARLLDPTRKGTTVHVQGRLSVVIRLVASVMLGVLGLFGVVVVLLPGGSLASTLFTGGLVVWGLVGAFWLFQGSRSERNQPNYHLQPTAGADREGRSAAPSGACRG